MIKVDLITGFLGSGKTSFIKKYASYFISQGQKLGILENDYGAVNVDMLLLSELRSKNCELEMVAGACDADCHRRRFKTKLIAMGMSGYDRVIIEPSGIFDVDEFFDTLHDEPLDRWYEIGNVITIVDARLEDNLGADGDFYLASQIANAGIIVLSKSQLASLAQIENTKNHIKKACEASKLNKNIDSIFFDKDWSSLSEDDFKVISTSGYQMSSYIKKKNGHDNDYSTLYFLDHSMSCSSIKSVINELMSNPKYGNVVRVKGFLNEEDKWYQINATKNELSIDKIPVGQQVFIVIGENLNKKAIEALISDFS